MRLLSLSFYPPSVVTSSLSLLSSSLRQQSLRLSQVVLQVPFAFECAARGGRRHFSPVRSRLSLQPPPHLTNTHSQPKITHSFHPSTSSHSFLPGLSLPPRWLTHRPPPLLQSDSQRCGALRSHPAHILPGLSANHI